MSDIPTGQELIKRSGIIAPHTIEASGLTWMAIHGNLSLAMRHPANQGASRLIVEAFLEELEQRLIEWDCLTPQEIQLHKEVEANARTR